MPAYDSGSRKRYVRKKKPASRSDAAQRTGAKTPKPKTVKPAAPVQRGHASEGGRTIRPKTVRKVKRSQERANRGKSDAAQGNQTRAADDFKKTQEFKDAQVAARRAAIRRAILRHEPIRASRVNTATKGRVPDSVLAQFRPPAADDPRYKRIRAASREYATPGAAGVVKALEQTTRPLHAVASAAKEDVKDIKAGRFPVGQGSLKHAVAGLKNEEKTTFSDVLKEAGVKNKAVRAVAGFGLDVALDPTTYVTFGTGTVARQAAVKAGRAAEKKAVAKGLSEAQARRMGERAAKRAARTASGAKGATVKVAGQEVPGVRRATAKAAKPVRKVTRRVIPERVRSGPRSIVADVNPNARAAGATKAETDEGIRATRAARARTNQGRDRAQKMALAIKKQVGEKNYQRVIDALESGSLKGLEPELRRVAVQVRSQFRYANRLRRQAGIRGGERKNYVPHQLTRETLEREGKKAGGVGSKVIRPSSSKARTEQRSLKELREAEPGRYSEDLANLFAGRMDEASRSVAKAELNRRLAAQGKDVKRGMDLPDGSGERAVFHIKGSDIRQVTDKAELRRLADQGGKTGRYVILNKDIVKRATEGVNPGLQGPGIVHALDKVQGGFKSIAVATPGFHVRNFIGDTSNAYLGQSGRRLPGNMRRSAKVLAAANRQDKAHLSFEQVKDGSKTFNAGRYGEVTYEEAARQLAKAGGYRTGYTAREIPELARSGSEGLKVRKVRLPQWMKRAGLNREDLPRVATAIEAVRRGATWEEAAQRVAKYHFDYQNLTQFERQIARRAAPFYTFSARNIPLQIRSLVTKPGKFATYEKLREEALNLSDVHQEAEKSRDLYRQLEDAGVKLPKDWNRYLTEWEQRNAGIPVTIGGKSYTISMGLPLTDLNETPGFAGDNQAQEYFQKVMSLITPIAKNPVEYFSNYSFFFRDEIEREYSPLVAAPSYVAKLPKGIRKDIGVTKMLQKSTGQYVWAWPAKTDYIVKQVPGTPQFVQNMLTEGKDRRGRGSYERVLGFLGFKATPIDPVSTAVGLAYERMGEIDRRTAALRQQGVSADNPTPEYTKLLEQRKLVLKVAYQGKDMRGDAVLPTQGGPPKTSGMSVRKRSSSRESSGFDLSGLHSSKGSGSSSSSGSSSGFDLSGLK